MHFLQHKGKGWFPPDMCDTKVQGHGDMRQFTLLAATSMDGVMLPHQIVFEGSTANCLPAFRNVTWKQSSDLGSGSVQKMEKQKVVECSTAFRGRMEHDHGDCKGKVCGCYVPTPRVGRGAHKPPVCGPPAAPRVPSALGAAAGARTRKGGREGVGEHAHSRVS